MLTHKSYLCFLALCLICGNLVVAQSYGGAYMPVDCPISGSTMTHGQISPNPASTSSISSGISSNPALTSADWEPLLQDIRIQSTHTYYPLLHSGMQDPYCHFTDEKYHHIYFVDIFKSPYKSAIHTLIKYCIVRGRGDSYQRFYPGHNITAEEAIKILTKSLIMTDRVRVSDKGDPYRSRKYYDKALEIQLINILPSQRDKQYGLTKKQAYMLLSEGLMLTHQQGNLKAYTSYVHDRHIGTQYLTRGQFAKMIVDVLGLK